MSADDDMRDRHGLPPRHRKPEPEYPVNLAPIRAVAQVWASRDTSGGPSLSQHVNTDTFARYAADAIPVLCDEIVRLRAALADQQVTPA